MTALVKCMQWVGLPVRRVPTIVFAVVTLVVSTTAGAQTSVSIAAGAAVPMMTDAKLNTGYVAIVALTSKPPLAAVGIRLEGLFASFEVAEGELANREHRMLGVIANATFARSHLSLRWPYLIGGLGLYNNRAPDALNDNNDIGFNAGIGVNLTTAVTTFFEVRYHHVPSEAGALRFVPITLGVRF